MPDPCSAGAAEEALLRTAYIGIGANLGDATATVQHAIDALAALPATRLTASSSLYRTAPVDATGPDYVNAVAAIATTLEPLALLRALQAIEATAGRERPFRNAPRTLDLDLLDIDGVVLDTPVLQLPHPRSHERAFVLVPWAEIAPDRVPAAWLAAVTAQRIVRICGAGPG